MTESLDRNEWRNTRILRTAESTLRGQKAPIIIPFELELQRRSTELQALNTHLDGDLPKLLREASTIQPLDAVIKLLFDADDNSLLKEAREVIEYASQSEVALTLDQMYEVLEKLIQDDIPPMWSIGLIGESVDEDEDGQDKQSSAFKIDSDQFNL